MSIGFRKGIWTGSTDFRVIKAELNIGAMSKHEVSLGE